MEESNVRKRPLDELPEWEIDSPDVKRLRENLLESLDDESDDCTASLDLDSVIKTFENEIVHSSASADLSLECKEYRSDLGYLLEASDDELGLPPTASSSSNVGDNSIRDEFDPSVLGNEFWKFDGELPDYDLFGFGNAETAADGRECAVVDGLFDYSDIGVESGEVSWRSETLPAQ